MNRHRCAHAGAAALALVATSLLTACATSAAHTGAGQSSLGTATGSGTPLPATSATVPPSVGGATPTGAPGTAHASGHQTHTHPPPPPSSSMPSSKPPPFAGDWSVSTSRFSNGHLECAWDPLPDGNVFIGSEFRFYYAGPNHPATVDYQVTNNVNTSVATGTLTFTNGLTGPVRSGSKILGSEISPFKQNGYAQITVTLLPGGADDRPSDDTVSQTVVVWAGIPPGPYTIDC